VRGGLKQPQISIYHHAHSVPIVNSGIEIYSAVFWLLRFHIKLAAKRHFSNAPYLIAHGKVPEALVAMITRHRENNPTVWWFNAVR